MIGKILIGIGLVILIVFVLGIILPFIMDSSSDDGYTPPSNGCKGCSGSAGLCKEYYCENNVCKIRTLSNCCGNGYCEYNTNENCRDCSRDCGSCKTFNIKSSVDIGGITCNAGWDATGCLIYATQSVANYYGFYDNYEYIQSRMSCDQTNCWFSIKSPLLNETGDPLKRVILNYPESNWFSSPFSICFGGGCRCEDIFSYFNSKGKKVYCSNFNNNLAKIFLTNNMPVIIGSDIDGTGHAYIIKGYDSGSLKTITPWNMFPSWWCLDKTFYTHNYNKIYMMALVMDKTQNSGEVCLYDNDCSYGLICANNMCQR